MEDVENYLLGRQAALDGEINYEQLTNHPSINSVELSGNKTTSDLGLIGEADVRTMMDYRLLGTSQALSSYDVSNLPKGLNVIMVLNGKITSDKTITFKKTINSVEKSVAVTFPKGVYQNAMIFVDVRNNNVNNLFEGFISYTYLDETTNKYIAVVGYLIIPLSGTAKYTDKTVENSELAPITYVNAYLSTLTGYDATKTQVLKNVEGTFTWVDE